MEANVVHPTLSVKVEQHRRNRWWLFLYQDGHVESAKPVWGSRERAERVAARWLTRRRHQVSMGLQRFVVNEQTED